MVCINYSRRLVFDKSFFIWLKNEDNDALLRKVIMHLLRINCSSELHKRCHNLMIEEDFKECLKIIDANTFKGAVRGESLEDLPGDDFIKIKDDFEKVIKYAVFLTNKKPFRSFIFTSPDNYDSYNSNPHYISVKTVTVKAGYDVVEILESFNKDFLSKKNTW